ncbi:Paris phage defense (ATPase) [Vibrio chagasii]|uniref:AAA family ATPase n=1 Tax=Vibrio crassostreae TaxID=246167 RepID=UPI000F487C92|nr:AAA family ATPase [Vibrio crassostreae]ROQ89123.1 putative ATP-binding protein involved in virulence [Vibrio crassostreae]CAH7070813.1 Paris phage defense (ATPase) [Vibrio chagasii]
MSDIGFKKVSLEGIHQRYNLNIELKEGLNVLHGQNGTGKSTLLHIIANIANRDFIRFAFLDFKSITVTYLDGRVLTITQKDRVTFIKAPNGGEFQFNIHDAIEYTDNERSYANRMHPIEPPRYEKLEEYLSLTDIPIIGTAYFPAFRTMLEAWASQRDNQDSRPISGKKIMSMRNATTFSRNVFGSFLPEINFPTPTEIEVNLRREIRDAQLAIARNESSIFSNSFVKVFSALLEKKPPQDLNSSEILQEIAHLSIESSQSIRPTAVEESNNAYDELQRVVMNGLDNSQDRTSKETTAGALAVYRDALKDRKEFKENAFKEIDKYLEVVNSFLDNKAINYKLDSDRRMPRVGLEFPDSSWSSIRVLSSGERQLLTMLYAVNKMSGNSAVLIDEPELSLHIDWQEDLLSKMIEQLGSRQIIVCTHSPAIAADFDERMIEVVPIFSDDQELLEEIDFDFDEDYL